MARAAREKSESGIYHVMIRGINHQQIFEDEEDSERFLLLLKRFKRECSFELLGYCLMGNHVHLLIREKEVPLQTIFRKLGASYVLYFNKKYGRIGHLFQDRFRSEVIRDAAQLLHTLRYIHLNPVKAGLCSFPEEYMFSSYNQYSRDEDGLADTELVISIISAEELVEYTRQSVEDTCMDIEKNICRRPTDREAKIIIKELCGCLSASDFQAIKKSERDWLIIQMKKKGLSITQINRLTGISRTIISRAK